MSDVLDWQKRESDSVTKHVSIADLRMRSIQGNLLHPTPTLPLSLEQYEVAPSMVRLADDAVLYHVTYALEVRSSVKRRVCDIEVTMSVLFQLNRTDLTTSELQSFGTLGVIDILHPYVREIVHSLTGRMGIPPLVLEVKQPLALKDG